jgi:hypothetical protein
MDLEGIGSLLAIVVALGSLAGVFVGLGKRDARIDTLEKRADEDRGRNSEQHKEFYETKYEVTSIGTKLADFDRRLTKVEEGIDELLRRIPRGAA